MVVWVLYLLAMSLFKARAKGQLVGWKLRAAQAFIAVAYVIDVIYNATIASLLFLELPREWTVTSRCNRHIEEGIGWRFQLSAGLCRVLLDPFALAGTHCRQPADN
jgi:hypothetical protein